MNVDTHKGSECDESYVNLKKKNIRGVTLDVSVIDNSSEIFFHVGINVFKV